LGNGFDGIAVVSGHTYTLTFSFLSRRFEGVISVGLYKDNKLLCEKIDISDCTEKEYSFSLIARKTETASLRFSFEGSGEISFSFIRFYDNESIDFGGQNPYGGRMRKDLVEALKELRPSFMRFPGGCIEEGYSLQNAYRWKDTIGRLSDRKAKCNLWGERERDGILTQSYEIGFYEYFLLAEYLGASPVPILNAGLACQARTTLEENFAFPETYCRDILDLIEYATAENGYWATKRKESGHEKPFPLKTIGIGNENWGEKYYQNFSYIYEKVREKYPDMEIIFTNGFGCSDGNDKRYIENRKRFDGKFRNLLSDDHFYRTPEWVFEHTTLYDSYDRTRYPVYLGEYAANGLSVKATQHNSYLSALSEAAFLTGLERNGDVVVMASYAPLFSRIGHEQWKHNLLNFDGFSVVKTMNYYVQFLFSRNVGTTYIPCKNVKKDIYLSVTRDRNFYYVKAVNVSRTEQRFSLPFDGTTAHSFLSCTNDNAINTLFHETVFPQNEEIYCDGTFLLPPRSIHVWKFSADTSGENFLLDK